jgi:hypothetical protein
MLKGNENIDETLVEAFSEVRSLYGCSVDVMVCTPEYRQSFLTRCREVLGEVPEHVLLQRLLGLRKRSKVPTLRQ